MESKIPLWQDEVLVAVSGTATWVFDWRGINDADTRKILRNGAGGAHDLVTDRIIQRYLDVCKYDLDAIILPFSVLGKFKEVASIGRTVAFLKPDDSPLEAQLDDMRRILTPLGPGMEGDLRISISDIRDSVGYYVEHVIKNRNELLSVTEIADNFWPSWLGAKKIKSTLHSWMFGVRQYSSEEKRYTDEYIPLLRPESPVVRGSSAGHRLSIADVVLFGFLLGTVGRGVKIVDFRGLGVLERIRVGDLRTRFEGHYGRR